MVGVKSSLVAWLAFAPLSQLVLDLLAGRSVLIPDFDSLIAVEVAAGPSAPKRRRTPVFPTISCAGIVRYIRSAHPFVYISDCS
jgi:hypothetical protein